MNQNRSYEKRLDIVTKMMNDLEKISIIKEIFQPSEEDQRPIQWYSDTVISTTIVWK